MSFFFGGKLQSQYCYVLISVFVVQGILKGFDQTVNIIVDECHERVYSENGVEIIALGLYIIRGDNMWVLISAAVVVVVVFQSRRNSNSADLLTFSPFQISHKFRTEL